MIACVDDADAARFADSFAVVLSPSSFLAVSSYYADTADTSGGYYCSLAIACNC